MYGNNVWDNDDADMGGANPSPPFSMPPLVNDVFGTIAGVTKDIITSRQAARTEANQYALQMANINAGTERVRIATAASTAVPNGTDSWFLKNILPGMFSNNPQSDVLARFTPQNNTVLFVILAIVGIAIFAFSRK